MWYYAKDGKQAGPVSADVLRGMLAGGQLRPADLVWREGMTDWVPVTSAPGLLPAAPPVASMPPQAFAPPPPAMTGWPQPPVPGGLQPGWPPPGAGYLAPIPAPPPDPAHKRAQSAAKASWTAVLIGVGLNMVANATRAGRRPDRSELLLVGFMSFAIYIFGLVAGVYALTRIPKFGPEGIRTPAIVGVILNGLIVAAFVAILVFAATQ